MEQIRASHTTHLHTYSFVVRLVLVIRTYVRTYVRTTGNNKGTNKNGSSGRLIRPKRQMIFQCCELVSFSFILPVLPILMRYSEWSCKRVYSKPTVLTLKHFRKNSPPYVHVFGPGTASLEISVVKIHPLTCTYSVQERVIRNKCRERGRMYVEISYGDGLFTLVNINVTNNILLSHLKSSASAEMIEEQIEIAHTMRHTMRHTTHDPTMKRVPSTEGPRRIRRDSYKRTRTSSSNGPLQGF